MNEITYRLDAYIQSYPFDFWDSGCETVPDQLYQAYAESHESDPAEISEGFKEHEEFLCALPLEDNNAELRLELHRESLEKRGGCCKNCNNHRFT